VATNLEVVIKEAQVVINLGEVTKEVEQQVATNLEEVTKEVEQLVATNLVEFIKEVQVGDISRIE